MSLTGFVVTPAVASRLRAFRPRGERVTGSALVPPATPWPQLAGTAFDYLLRFELHRRHPHAEVGSWVAEGAAGLIYEKTPTGSIERNPFPVDSEHWVPGPLLARRCQAVVDEARRLLDAYRHQPPDDGRLRELAAAAVKLAQLDAVVRGRRLDPGFERADDGAVDELLRLLAVVPFDRLVRPGRLLLNPTFGDASVRVGGADADLITGDLLVDVKTTKTCELKSDSLDQLFGYYLLARQARRTDPAFPEVRSVGLYFSRFARLWEFDVTGWTARPDFADTERWFFETADEEFGLNPADG